MTRSDVFNDGWIDYLHKLRWDLVDMELQHSLVKARSPVHGLKQAALRQLAGLGSDAGNITCLCGEIQLSSI